MKKIILLGIMFLLIGAFSTSAIATYLCGDGICEAEYCPSDCTTYLSSYCGDLIEPYECDDICGSELGWIRPPDCVDYGYTPTEDCAAECEECEETDCIDSGCTFTTRDGLETFCESYDFIRAEDCPECVSGGSYSSCDSCCPATSGSYNEEEECPFQWWLLIIGALAGYFYKKKKQ